MERLLSFTARYALCLLIGFMLYPISFVLFTSGFNSAFSASVVMMIFLQFISPLHLWVWPVAGAFIAAIAWEISRKRDAIERE